MKLFTLMIATCVVPLVMRMRVVNLVGYFKGTPLEPWAYSAEVFTFYKSMIVILCGAFCFLRTVWKPPENPMTAIGPLVIAYVGLSLASIPGEFHEISLFGFPGRYEGILVMFSYLAFCWAASTLTMRQRKTLLIGLAGSSSAVATIGILQYFYPHFLTWPGLHGFVFADYPFIDNPKVSTGQYWSITSTLGHPNFVGSYLCLLLPLMSVWALNAGGIWKWAIGGVVLILGAFLAASLSRGGITGVCFGLGVVAIFGFKIRASHLARAAVFLILISGVGTGIYLKNPVHFKAKFVPDFTLTGRTNTWKTALPMFKKTALLGHGPGTFALHYPKRRVNGSKITLMDMAHNLYLQTIHATGGLSLLCLATIFLIYLVRFWRRRIEQDWMSIGILGGLCAYLLAGIVNNSFVGVAPIFWVFLGIGLNVTRERNYEGR